MSVATAIPGSNQPTFAAVRNKASVEDVLLSNLALLGMDIDGSEKKYGCSISRDMFHAPNVKAMEATLHFLLTKASAEARDAFRVLWPILDKKQSRDFKTTCHKLLQKLEEEGHIPTGTVRLSHFQSASGERLQIMLWHLSIHVMKTVMENEKCAVPHLPSLWDSSATLTGLPAPVVTANLEAMKHVTQLKIHQQTSKFIDLATKLSSAEAEWQELAKSIEAEYRKASKQASVIAQQTREFEVHCARTKSASASEGVSSKQDGSAACTTAEMDEALLEEVDEAWRALARHIHLSHTTHKRIIDSILDKKANSTLFDAKHIKLETSALVSLGTTSNIEDKDGKLDLIALTKMWTHCLQELRHRLKSMTKSMQSTTATTTKQISQGNKENKDNADVLSEMTSRLEQLSSQHLQYTSTIRTLIQNLREKLPESHEFIAQLQLSISNSVAASAMASNLKQLLVDTTDSISSNTMSLMAHPSATPSTTGRLISQRPSATPLKASSLALIPPTPRDGVAHGHHRSTSSGVVPLVDTRRGISTPSLGISKHGSLMTPLPSSTPSRGSDSSLRRTTLANSWMSDFDEATLIAEINAGVVSTALGPSEQIHLVAPPHHHQQQQQQQHAATPHQQPFSANYSVHSEGDSDLLNTSTSSARSCSSGPRTAQSARRANRHSSPAMNAAEIVRLNPSLGFDPSLGLSPLRLDSTTAPTSIDSISSFSTTPNDGLHHYGRAGSVSPAPFRHSMEDVTSGLNWNSGHSSHRTTFSNPPSHTSTPRSSAETIAMSHTSTPETFIRFPSTKRNRASLDLDRTNTTNTTATNTTSATPNASHHGSSPTMASPSPLSIASSASPLFRAAGSGKVQVHSSSSSPITTVAFQRASQEAHDANEQQRMMDELAEQIVDIMGAATNISSADVARHTMALLGVKSPVVSQLSSASSAAASSSSSVSSAAPSPRTASPRVVSPLTAHHSNNTTAQPPFSTSSAPVVRRHEKVRSGQLETAKRASLHERRSSSPGPANGFAQAMLFGARHAVLGTESLVEIESQLAELDNSIVSNPSQRLGEDDPLLDEMEYEGNTSIHIVDSSYLSSRQGGDMNFDLDGSLGFEPGFTSQSPPMVKKRLSRMSSDFVAHVAQPRENPFAAPSRLHDNDISVTLLEAQLAELASPKASRYDSHNTSQILMDDYIDEQIMAAGAAATHGEEEEMQAGEVDEDLELEAELRRLEEESRLRASSASFEEEDQAMDYEEDETEAENGPYEEHEQQAAEEEQTYTEASAAVTMADDHNDNFDDEEDDDEFHDASAEFEDEEQEQPSINQSFDAAIVSTVAAVDQDENYQEDVQTFVGPVHKQEEASIALPQEATTEADIFEGAEVDSRLDTSLPSALALETPEIAFSSPLAISEPSLLEAYLQTRPKEEPKRPSFGEISKLQPVSTVQFSLEPYLFDYPTPSKAPMLPQVSYEEPQLETIELDFEDDDLLAPITSYAAKLSPPASAPTATDAIVLEPEYPLAELDGLLAQDLEQCLMMETPANSKVASARARLNLSINPDDSLNASDISPTMDRIKKVLDFD